MDDRNGVAVVGSINARSGGLRLAAAAARARRSSAPTFRWSWAERERIRRSPPHRAGAPTYMIGAVGDDMFRDLTLTTLAAEGIDVSAVRITDWRNRNRPYPRRCRLRPRTTS